MKKTISITLSGIIFNLEEDGYIKLKAYLDAIREYFSKLDDNSPEIMEDIESRAAEIFSERLSAAKQVITLSDVEELIASMGTVEDITGEAKPEEERPKTKSWKEKKLYRDPDNAILMGVCAGIANYFGIDPVIIRILFLLSFFFGGAGVIIYLILCLIVPEAKSTAQKMEMHGQPVNLTSLKEAAEEKIVTARKNISTQPIRKIVLTIGRLVRKLFLIGLIILGVALIVGSLAALVGIFVLFGNLFFNAGMVLANFPEMKMMPGTQYHLGIIAGFFTALIPIFFALFLGISIIRRRFILNLTASLCLLMVWIISVSTLGVLATRLFAKHEERTQVISESEIVAKKYDFSDFDSISAFGNYQLKIEKGDEYKVEAQGHDGDFDSVLISQEGRKLEIDEDHRGICIFCYDHRIAKEIIITMPELKEFQSDGMTRATISGFDQDEMKVDLRGTDSATADIRVKDMKIDMDGMARLTISGYAENMNGKIDGMNRLQATDLEAKNVNLNVDGNSDVEVWATDKLDARVGGVSKVSYKGNPSITKKVSETARLEKR